MITNDQLTLAIEDAIADVETHNDNYDTSDIFNEIECNLAVNLDEEHYVFVANYLIKRNTR